MFHRELQPAHQHRLVLMLPWRQVSCSEMQAPGLEQSHLAPSGIC